MPPRFYLELPLSAGDELTLPSGPSRHAQVLRLQPGDAMTLFNGQGGEWQAEVLQMGRKDVQVRIGLQHPADRELPMQVTLALGVPANERMDNLVEKATELGVAAIQPLMCERSVLRLSGERADRKREHWQAVAVAACEQSGRTRVPRVQPVSTLNTWLQAQAGTPDAKWLLSTGEAPPPSLAMLKAGAVTLLSGPEGGLSAAEESAARGAGFQGISLGARILRADTAPLAALAWWGVSSLRADPAAD